MDAKETLIALRRIMRAVDLHSKQLERTAGLTVPQLLVLQALAGHEGRATGAIAREIHLSQGTVTTIVDRMVSKGLVARERGTADRRRMELTLTPAGLAKLDEAPGMLQEGFIGRFEALKSWEQKMLTASLERVAELMDAQDVDASPILESGELVKVVPRPDRK